MNTFDLVPWQYWCVHNSIRNQIYVNRFRFCLSFSFTAFRRFHFYAFLQSRETECCPCIWYLLTTLQYQYCDGTCKSIRLSCHSIKIAFRNTKICFFVDAQHLHHYSRGNGVDYSSKSRACCVWWTKYSCVSAAMFIRDVSSSYTAIGIRTSNLQSSHHHRRLSFRNRNVLYSHFCKWYLNRIQVLCMFCSILHNNTTHRLLPLFSSSLLLLLLLLLLTTLNNKIMKTCFKRV